MSDCVEACRARYPRFRCKCFVAFQEGCEDCAKGSITPAEEVARDRRLDHAR